MTAPTLFDAEPLSFVAVCARCGATLAVVEGITHDTHPDDAAAVTWHAGALWCYLAQTEHDRAGCPSATSAERGSIDP